MKKENLYFILECIIIVLLLAVLGVLLKDNGGRGREEMLSKTRAEHESVPVVVGSQDIQLGHEESEFVPEEETTQPQITEPLDDYSKETVSSNGTDKFLEGKNIVVFGDSIWNDGRGVDGICEHVQQQTGATIYNCAVGGTTAALIGEDMGIEYWTSSSFNGMIYVARDLVPVEKVIPEEEATEIICQVNFEEMDYVIISYGLNDFFSNVPVYPKTYYDMTSYIGALRNGINKLQENYPHLQIILVSPTYTKQYEGEKLFRIGDYVEAARSVAGEMNVHFLDMFHVLGNNEESRMAHLEDGVHMSADGRKEYADAVIHFLGNIETAN